MFGAEQTTYLPVLSTRAVPKARGSGYFSTTVILWVPNLSVLPEAAEFAVLMQLFDPHDL